MSLSEHYEIFVLRLVEFTSLSEGKRPEGRIYTV